MWVMAVDTVNWVDQALCKVTRAKFADFALEKNMPTIQTRKSYKDS